MTEYVHSEQNEWAQFNGLTYTLTFMYAYLIKKKEKKN